MSSYFFLVRSYNIVVRNRFSVMIFSVPEQDYGDDMSVVFSQVIELSAVPVFLLITRILFSPALLYCFSEMMFILSHHRVIERICDVLPSFLGQVHLIAVAVCHRPANFSYVHQIKPTFCLSKSTNSHYYPQGLSTRA